MSYQIYVTGGHGFTEAILPTLLHPSTAVDMARDYFTRGYQGHHIDLPPDADFSQSGNLTDTQRQKLLDDLRDGRLVLSSRYGRPGFALFSESEASPDTLRNDLPPAFRQRLQQQWPGRSRGGAAISDSLAPANEPTTHSPEAPVPDILVLGAGPYHVKLAYRWPDGTGVAGLPFTIGTDDENVKGTLDHNGEAQVAGLHGRFASVRLSSDVSDGDVDHQRRGIQHVLGEILKREQKEAEDLAHEYRQLPWYQRAAVSSGAVFQGVADAGISLFRFVDGMGDLSSPTQTLLDGLKSAWAASDGSPDTSWYASFLAHYNEARHQRWVEALGFSPSDISREDVAEAYDLASLVMADPQLRESLTDFAADYAETQHHTEVSYFAGSVAFDLILAGLLAVATGGVGVAGAAGSRIRHTGLLIHLGKVVKAYANAVRKQRLRRLWRTVDLNKQDYLEATAPNRVDGLDLKPAKNVPNKVNPSAQVLLARQRQARMLEENVGLNISPTAWDSYPTIGRNGTFISDRQGITDIIGDFSGQSQLTLDKTKVLQLEEAFGLERGALQEGFKIRQVDNVVDRMTRSPMEGNQYFLGPGNHLPGGAPEMVIDSIPTVDANGVTTLLEVLVK
ncbi:hypothetical protein [Marinobacter halodurans]|uniref:hypothetical protein n=1 Tax=Marinobacter halodurans TaxID=2528979 RepID=UPI001A955186|nr:hypothetical protein [Marinobacter halodurans]